MSETSLLRVRGFTKRFGDLIANDAVDLDLGRGEVLALLGENGAGKTTLMKLVYGFYPRDAGAIEIDGAAATIGSPRDAMALGIGMVFQQFSLLPALTVTENLLLAWPKSWHWRSAPKESAVLEKLRALAPGISPAARIRDLSVGERQLVEVARILNLGARIVILDEPTSVLTPQEAARLHKLVRGMAADGKSVVMITHKLADVRACADRVAIMRRGKLVDAAPIGDRSDGALVTAMVGERSNPVAMRHARPVGPPRLVLRSLCSAGPQPVTDIDLEIRRGEIVGIAGVAGNGQWSLAETVAGLVAPRSGGILLDGEPVARTSEHQAFASPIAYIPEEPIRNAVVGSLDLAANLNLRTLGSTAAPQSDSATGELLRAFDVRPPEPERRAGTLSGGNLQKLVAARELGKAPAAIVACYPTMGLDINATEAIIGRLVALADAGAAVLWISEEIDDLLRAADRIAVLNAGRLTAILDAASTDAAEIGRHMTGHRAAA